MPFAGGVLTIHDTFREQNNNRKKILQEQRIFLVTTSMPDLHHTFPSPVFSPPFSLFPCFFFLFLYPSFALFFSSIYPSCSLPYCSLSSYSSSIFRYPSIILRQHPFLNYSPLRPFLSSSPLSLPFSLQSLIYPYY